MSKQASSCRAISFSCRGCAPVPAPISEIIVKSWMRRVGTGILPLQNDDLSENEIALRTIMIKKLYRDIMCLMTLEGHSSIVSSVAISPDGQTLASGSWDKTVKLWNLQNGELIRTIQPHSMWAKVVAFSPDGQTVASGDEDWKIQLWDVKTGQRLQTLQIGLIELEQTITALAFSPDSKTLVSGSEGGNSEVWDVETGERLDLLGGYSRSASRLTIDPNGRLIAGGYLNSVRVWSLASLKLQHEWETSAGAVHSVALSPDSQIMAAGNTKGTIELWNPHTGELLQTLEGHSASVEAVAISPDGETLASGANDKTVKLWNLNTAQIERTLEGHSGVVTSVAFSPDSQKIVSGSTDETIKIWGWQ